MDRRVYTSLQAWKRDPARKPLVLRGARQVGKTWLLREFGRREFDDLVYVNLQRDRTAAALFDGDLDPNRILAGLELASRTTIDPATTLVVLDEIQDVAPALTSLKYFAEDRPDVHLAAAGSLLGVAMRAGASFPVGKVNFLDLYPLDFEEFLSGVGEHSLARAVAQPDWGLINPFHERLVELLKTYLYVGGMPEVVARHADGATVDDVRDIQLAIARGYEADFAKYADGATSRRVAQVWESLPAQLAREQRRFILGRVREGARAREFEDAIQWLVDSGLVHRVTRFAKPASPIRSYADPKIFKLFAHDVGILGALAGLDSTLLAEATGVFEEFKGALTEQYVLQQIVAVSDEIPTYWSRENSSGEIDFAIERDANLIPIEVQASENVRSRSLRSYIDSFTPVGAFRFSLARYREQDDFVNVPLYAIGSKLR